MIDVCNGPFISLREAAKLPELTRNGRKPHVASLYRWAGPGGVRGVRLPSWQIGGTRCTTAQAVREFIHELTQRSTATTPSEQDTPPCATPVQRTAEAMLRARTRGASGR